MKLNPECLRATLIFLEKNLKMTAELKFENMGINEIAVQINNSEEYSKEDVAYSIYMLADADLISILPGTSFVHEIRVESLTYKGHEFLAQIANETVWKKTMERIKPLGTFAIKIVSDVAASVIKDLVLSSLPL